MTISLPFSLSQLHLTFTITTTTNPPKKTQRKMTSTSILSASTHSNLSFNKDSKFVLHYFNYHGLGATIRALLCYGEVQWENQIQPFPEWMEIRPTTPFGCIPILKETVVSTGEEFAIPESQAIERYLGRKFGLMGDTPREQTLNDIFYAQATILFVKYTETVLFTYDEVREKALTVFMQRLESWVKSCEVHLKENGNTGHFVDNKVCFFRYLCCDCCFVCRPCGKKSSIHLIIFFSSMFCRQHSRTYEPLRCWIS